MAFGMVAQNDYNMKGDKAGNAKYANQKGTGPGLKAPGWGYETISRNLDSLKELDPAKIMEARNNVDYMPLDEREKSGMRKKLTDALNFSKIIKIG
jgi:hypothetical protein